MKTKLLYNNSSNSPINSQLIVYSISNYKPILNYTVSEILGTFINIIIEYIKLISEKIVIKNKMYYAFIFERGLETIIHVFSILLYYTKNLDLTYYHSQKAYFFYIEFIEQISDDTVTYLKLTSRDAILFVYKKTIYEINNEYKKNIKDLTIEEKKILSTLDDCIYLFKNITLYLINNNDFKNSNKEYIETSCNSINTICELLNKKNKNKIITCTNKFALFLIDKKINVRVLLELLENFIHNINTLKKIDENEIEKSIFSSEICMLMDNNNFDKVIEIGRAHV
mgnify:CR=1 FL=1